MNFRIVLHLFQTDWRRLKWLVVCCWILMLLTAWPAISFSPANFDTPLQYQVSISYPIHTVNNAIATALEKQGEILRTVNGCYLSLRWMLTGASLILAGTLGFHALGWTVTRPARRCETLAAKALGLAVFLFIPLLAIAAAVSIAHGFGTGHAIQSVATAAAIILPRLLGVCLFGALCGAWWRWLAGMFALLAASSVAPLILAGATGPDWFSDSLGASGMIIPIAPLWVAVAVPLILLAVTSRHLNPARRIGTAMLAMLIIPTWLPHPALPMPQAEVLPDWSTTVKPVLADLELHAQVEASSWFINYEPGSYEYFNRVAKTPHAELRLKWDVEGLPPGVFATWARTGSSQLVAGSVAISSEIPSDQQNPADHQSPLGPDLRALTSALPTGTQPIHLTEINYKTDGSEMIDVLDPLEPSFYKSTTLNIDLAGTAYRMEKVLDVPFGKPVEATANGIKLRIRRLDLTGYTDLSVPGHPYTFRNLPLVDVSYVSPVPWNPWMGFYWSLDGLPGSTWSMFLHLPDTGEFRRLQIIHQVAEPLSPNCVGVRQWYLSGPFVSGVQPDLSGFENARIVVLKRVNLGRMRKSYQSESMPLLVTRDDPTDRSERTTASKLKQRPDPATATDHDLNTWLQRSYDAFDRNGWDSRSLADFIPRHLDLLLARHSGIQPPSSPEGKALALACPESRRDEVLGALLRRNREPDSNWISDVILKRGWAKDAAPLIRRMVDRNGIAGNPYSLVMLASLEDPYWYPTIIDSVRKGHCGAFWQQLRLLPGMEPELSAAIMDYYQHAKKSAHEKSVKSNKTRPVDPADLVRDKLNLAIMPAAFGLQQPFADLMDAWSAMSPRDQLNRASTMREVILLSGDPNDWQMMITGLAGKKAADFRYDRLARQWLPLSQTPP